MALKGRPRVICFVTVRVELNARFLAVRPKHLSSRYEISLKLLNDISPSSSATPPPFEHKAFYLVILLPNAYFVKQIDTTELRENVSSFPDGSKFFSVTRTPEEIFIVGEITNDPRIRELSEGFSALTIGVTYK